MKVKDAIKYLELLPDDLDVSIVVGTVFINTTPPNQSPAPQFVPNYTPAPWPKYPVMHSQFGDH